MISRTINIRKNSSKDLIEEFAKIMNIKNFFLCEDRGNDNIDFSFYEKSEPQFCYETYHSIKDGFDYFLDINLYIDYDEFWSLLINVSKKGFDICLPNELSNSPYDWHLFKNGQVFQVLEDGLDNDDIFKVRHIREN